MYRTRGARGGSKLNRTLYESPATASLHSATPKRKNVPCFFDFSRGWIFSKMERTFFFLGFCPPSIRAVRRGFNIGLGFAKTIFWGYGFSQNRD